MKTNIRLMVVLAGLAIMGNMFAGTWRFANKSSYKMKIDFTGGSRDLPAKSRTGAAVGPNVDAWDIYSMAGSGRIEIHPSGEPGVAILKYGPGSKVGTNGKLGSGATSKNVRVSDFDPNTNPPVFVIDVGYTTGFKVEVFPLQKLPGNYKITMP